MVGTADSVFIREVSLIQSVLYSEVPLYFCLFAVLSGLPKDEAPGAPDGP